MVQSPQPEFTQLLSHWYHLLSARHVDLVGDYAGSELFIIEGDSLLQRCLAEPELDFEDGLQLLHAVYAVETFLNSLITRKCVFNVVFIEQHALCCVPLWSRPEHRHKYLLARAVIIRHLQVHVPVAHPHVSIKVFASLQSQDLITYLADTGAYFIMCHDGAAQKPTSAAASTKEPNPVQLSFRTTIHFFMAKGYNVALINGVHFQDTKVWTTILEKSRRSRVQHPTIDRGLSESQVDGNLIDAASESIADIHSEAQLLTVHTLRLLLGDNIVDESFARAVVLQSVLLSYLPLSARRPNQPRKFADAASEHLKAFCDTASQLLRHERWATFARHFEASCDVADLIDGQVLAGIITQVPEILQKSPTVKGHVIKMLDVLGLSPTRFSDTSMRTIPGILRQPISPRQQDDKNAYTKLLPFQNPVFDRHLAPVQIDVDSTAITDTEDVSTRIFRELSHWHNQKPLQVPKGRMPQDPRQIERMLRRNQFFMSEMTAYAASLTNAAGKMLEPETIVMSKSSNTIKGGAKPSSSSENCNPSSTKGTKPAEKKSSKKEAIIAANIAQKERAVEEKYLSLWKSRLDSFQRESNLIVRYRQTHSCLSDLPQQALDLIGAEVQLYMLDALLRLWRQIRKTDARDNNMNVAALMWNIIRQMQGRAGITPKINTHVTFTCQRLGFSSPELEITSADRRLSFAFFNNSDVNLVATDNAKVFQLEHCGPYMERSIDSTADTRTRFYPDRWQRDVLDAIDASKSLFVVAPTSAGKTFISFYAMKKVLQADNDGVVVYVAPTKALVNQIAAEIQANFRKPYNTPGKSVWALHTRDYRVNSPTGCQILVTVPHILQIMLLSPSNARNWSTRVKRIIFDEIHSIGQAEDGIVWEQLLLLAPCPIIALSATVGNPKEFSDWLGATQRSLGNELVMVQHAHRYSDLRKYIYTPYEPSNFRGLQFEPPFAEMGLDKASESFTNIHPILSLVNRRRGLPVDLSLEPRECLSLWRALKQHETNHFQVHDLLDPTRFFNGEIRKRDIYEWSTALKHVLTTWINDPHSPFDKVLRELSSAVRAKLEDLTEPPGISDQQVKTVNSAEAREMLASTLPMLVELHQRDALPAILFNYDRGFCEKLGSNILDQLQAAERSYKSDNKTWARRVEQWEAWKKRQEKKRNTHTKGKATKGRSNDEDADLSRADRLREAAESEVDIFASFDPEEPLESYSFANPKKLSRAELDETLWKLKKWEVTPWLRDGLVRGIGIHHAGMPRVYRQAVEVLFRTGYLRVVIATGTLALGINMPCKTVVFSGDSVFLTALNYRQAAGRAGRRGFDLLGNVVFQSLSLEKVCRLESSRLPSLHGHFPITTSLVLRLFILLHESNYAEYAKNAVNSLLSQPRLFLGGQSFKDQVHHHLRFSIEYLRRSGLLATDGAPLNFAGMVSHLYFTENASFALHALLKGGYFHRLTANFPGTEENEVDTLREMMAVLAHLFGRRPLRQADLEPDNLARIKRSSSIVLLPSMPNDAREILAQHTNETLNIFTTYVQTFSEQHLQDRNDNVLPFTGTAYGGSASVNEYQAIIDAPKPCTVRSHFVALSGHDDSFMNINELCRTVRSGVFLEESVIPYVTLYPDTNSPPLNAYLLDFYKHGSTKDLEAANGIRKSDVWFLLNDFSLVLATIVTSLKNYFKLGENADVDMTDLQGGGDMQEELHDEQLAMSEVGTSDVLEPDAAKKPVPAKTKGSKKKTASEIDNWDDEAASSDGDSASVGDELESSRTTHSHQHTSSTGATTPLTAPSAFGDTGMSEGGQDLRKVLKAFERLKVTFDEKFRAMWA